MEEKARVRNKRRKQQEVEREEWENKRVRMLLNSDLAEEYEEILGLGSI